MSSLITKHIPNTLTLCNLLSGAAATVYALEGDFVMALTMIIIGAVFDFFDGFSARMLGVSTGIGKELDSLADDITFGLAPAAVVFTLLQSFVQLADAPWTWVPWMGFLIAAFSARRLAVFNLDTRQTGSFIGLATPANALFWGAFAISMKAWLLANGIGLYLVLILIVLSCWLMNAELPMFALKFKSFAWRPNAVRYLFLLSSMLIILGFLLLVNSIAGVWIAILWYIVLSVAFGAQ